MHSDYVTVFRKQVHFQCAHTNVPHYCCCTMNFILDLLVFALMEFIRRKKKNPIIYSMSVTFQLYSIVFFYVREHVGPGKYRGNNNKKKNTNAFAVRTLNQFIFTDCLFLCFFYFFHLFIFCGGCCRWHINTPPRVNREKNRAQHTTNTHTHSEVWGDDVQFCISDELR